MSAYGSGTGPEYLDESPEDLDGWARVLPYHVTWANGSTHHAHYEDASRFAETFVERGVAVEVTCGEASVWSYEPGRTNERGES